MKIRSVVPDDAEAVVSLINAYDVTSFATARALRSVLEQDDPPGTERLVAESGGEIVGFSRCRLAADGGGWAWVGVRPEHRRRGLGSELYDRLETTLRSRGAASVQATVSGAEAGPFALRHGFEQARVMRLQALDLSTADLPEPSIETVSLAETGVESIRALYLATLADVPFPTPRAIDDDDFRRQVSDSEIVDLEVSRVVLEDGAPIAFTVVVANDESGRAGPQMTGVRRDRRGRGLAQAVKVASAWHARERGLRVLVTANDLDNEPMLAINRKLGFEPSILVEEYRKQL